LSCAGSLEKVPASAARRNEQGDVSRPAVGAHLPSEELTKAIVVSDCGEAACLSGEGDRRECWTVVTVSSDQLSRQVLSFGRRPAVPRYEQPCAVGEAGSEFSTPLL